MLNSPPTSPEVSSLNGTSAAPEFLSHASTTGGNGAGGGDVWDVGALLSLLWRRRRLMLTTFALVLLAGIGLTLSQRSIYEATCSMLITSPNDNSPAAGESLRALLQASQPRSVGTQIAIMRSYPVQRATLKRLSPAQQEIARQFNDLEVRPQRDSEAIDIVAQSTDPNVAARLANALSEEYMAQYQEQNRLQVIAGTREVKAQLAGARQRLDDAATALKNYKLRNGTVNLSEESTARLAEVNRIQVELRGLQADRAATVAQISALSGQIKGMPQVQVVPDRIVRSPALEALRGQLVQLDLRRIEVLRRYRPGSPEVRAIEIQSADVEAQLQKVTRTEISSWTRSVNPVRQGLSQEIARAQAQIASTDARVAALRQAEAGAQAREALLPEREYSLSKLINEQTALLQTYQLLNQKYQSLIVSEGAKLTTARPLAPAEAPNNPISPRRALNLAMSILLGGFLAIALAVFADKTDDRVRSARNAEEAAQLPVLAKIPSAGIASAQVLSAQAQSSPLLESFRLLRTSLMTTGAGGAPTLPRSILVTSSRAGEGAALCALNLAIAVAMGGRNVLLIEADLRHPMLRDLLQLDAARGLSEVVRGEIALEAALQTTNVPNLQFLDSGADLSSAAELLDSDAARQILQSAIARADCTIMSGPPVLGFADTPILTAIAGCALLVVSSEASQSSEIAQARETLARTGVRLPGIVLNNVKTT